MRLGLLFLAAFPAGCRRPDPHDPVRGDGGDTDDVVETIVPSDDGCGLTSDLASPWFLEGDTVTFTVACSGALPTTDAVVEPLALPADATFDPEALRFTWVTGPADAGRVDQAFRVSARGASEPAALAAVSFWVAENPEIPDDVPVDPSRYTEEWGLPVLHLESAAELTEEYGDATVTWGGAAYPASVKIHGKTSTHYPKLSYAVRFDADELPIDAWGVTRDHLLLISTFDDASYVRQKLTYDLWAAIAETWGEARLTPRALFTVVYLDGRYHGLYLGVDRVDDEFVDQMGFERDGNLYKAVDSDANYFATDGDGYPKETPHDGFEKVEGEPLDDFSDLDALVTFTSTSSTPDLLAGADAWIDPHEFMDWFLLVHYTTAEDSTDKNAYLHHPLAGGRFRYVPWDFNASWGQNWRTYRMPADFENDYLDDNRVFAAIQEDPDADAELWARFATLRDRGPFSLAWQLAELDACYAAVDPSARRDWAAWGAAYTTYEGWADHREEAGDLLDYEGERAYLSQWIVDRAARFEVLHP